MNPSIGAANNNPDISEDETESLFNDLTSPAGEVLAQPTWMILKAMFNCDAAIEP